LFRHYGGVYVSRDGASRYRSGASVTAWTSCAAPKTRSRYRRWASLDHQLELRWLLDGKVRQLAAA
jgi:hypothetical protein